MVLNEESRSPQYVKKLPHAWGLSLVQHRHSPRAYQFSNRGLNLGPAAEQTRATDVPFLELFTINFILNINAA